MFNIPYLIFNIHFSIFIIQCANIQQMMSEDESGYLVTLAISYRYVFFASISNPVDECFIFLLSQGELGGDTVDPTPP